jgi:hypothetical protein
MATLPKVLINRADYQIGGGVALRLRTQDEPDPGDLMRPFPANPMRMWPISTRVNKPENDDPSIVEPIALAASAT